MEIVTAGAFFGTLCAFYLMFEGMRTMIVYRNGGSGGIKPQ